MANPPPGAARLAELMARRAVEGLSAAEYEELEVLSARYPAVDPEALERAAAALVLCGLRIEPMPAGLRARIEADARAFLAGDVD
jgi:hypothetical protein